MCPLLLTEPDFMSANAISRNISILIIASIPLNVSVGMLFQSICCPYDADHFPSIPNSLTKLTASVYTV